MRNQYPSSSVYQDDNLQAQEIRALVNGVRYSNQVPRINFRKIIIRYAACYKAQMNDQIMREAWDYFLEGLKEYLGYGRQVEPNSLDQCIQYLTNLVAFAMPRDLADSLMYQYAENLLNMTEQYISHQLLIRNQNEDLETTFARLRTVFTLIEEIKQSGLVSDHQIFENIKRHKMKKLNNLQNIFNSLSQDHLDTHQLYPYYRQAQQFAYANPSVLNEFKKILTKYLRRSLRNLHREQCVNRFSQKINEIRMKFNGYVDLQLDRYFGQAFLKFKEKQVIKFLFANEKMRKQQIQQLTRFDESVRLYFPSEIQNLISKLKNIQLRNEQKPQQQVINYERDNNDIQDQNQLESGKPIWYSLFRRRDRSGTEILRLNILPSQGSKQIKLQVMINGIVLNRFGYYVPEEPNI